MASFPFSHSFGQNLNIATYNIRFDNANDLGNLWKDRAPHLINQIKFHKPDTNLIKTINLKKTTRKVSIKGNFTFCVQ